MSANVVTTEQAQPSHLLKIPPELRLPIYELAVPQVHFRLIVDEKGVRIEQDRARVPALLQSCRLVRREASPIFYGQATFTITPWSAEALARSRWGRKMQMKFPICIALSEFPLWSRMKQVSIWLSFNSNEELDDLKPSVAGMLRLMDACKDVKYLFLGIEYTDETVSSVDEFAGMMRGLKCKGSIESSLKQFGNEEYRGTGYAELCEELQIKNVSTPTGWQNDTA